MKDTSSASTDLHGHSYIETWTNKDMMDNSISRNEDSKRSAWHSHAPSGKIYVHSMWGWWVGKTVSLHMQTLRAAKVWGNPNKAKSCTRRDIDALRHGKEASSWQAVPMQQRDMLRPSFSFFCWYLDPCVAVHLYSGTSSHVFGIAKIPYKTKWYTSGVMAPHGCIQNFIHPNNILQKQNCFGRASSFCKFCNN
jgi:hypothetical protein